MVLFLEPGNWKEYDPFLMLAEDFFQKGTFDLHPHRGIETVTYLNDGKLEHFDNKAGYGKLEPGDVQWMTAERGVIHKEDPSSRFYRAQLNHVPVTTVEILLEPAASVVQDLPGSFNGFFIF
jgi:quercetin 2,3-dioxygenase